MTKPKTKDADAVPAIEAKAVEGELHEGAMPEDNPDGISPEETTGAIVPLDTIDLPALLSTGAGTDELIARIRKVTTAIVPDMTTEAGRKAVKSLAYRVSRTKSLFDEARLAHTKGLREQIENINGNGKKLIAELDKIRDEVRAPVVEWEEFETAYAEAMIEDARRDAEALERLEQFNRDVQTRIDAWRNFPSAFLDDDMDLDKAEGMLTQARAVEFTAADFGDRIADAQQIRDAAIAKVDKLLEMRRTLAKAEQDVADAKAESERAAQEKIDRAARIDTEIANYRRITLDKAYTLKAADLLTLIDGVERTVFNGEFYAERLADAYAARGTLIEELRVMHAAQVELEAADAAVEAQRVADAEALAARQRRDDILGRIQGLQTTVIMAASGRTGDELQAMRDKFAAKELDPAEWDDLLEQATESKAAALAKLDELITKERAAEADRAEAARLRQEAAAREEAAAQERTAQAARDAQAATESHREAVRTEVSKALSDLGVDSVQLPGLLAALEAGEIPHVMLQF